MPTYRTNGAWGSGIGVNLTPAQVDENFYELRTDLDDVIANPPTANSIETITANGFTWTVQLTDGTILDPLPVPVVYTVWRGDWTPLTLYSEADLFRVEDQGIFAVLQDHTSAATFDPDAVAGSPPALLYTLLIGVSSLPADTTLDELSDVTITSVADDDFIAWDAGSSLWTNRTSAAVASLLSSLTNLDDLADVIAPSPLAGQVLRYIGGSPDAGWQPDTLILDDLSDVAAASPNDGDVLTYQAGSPTGWIAAAVPAIPSALDDLTDVVAPGPSDGDLLQFDGADWVNAAGSAISDLTSATAPFTGSGYMEVSEPSGSPATYTSKKILINDLFNTRTLSGTTTLPGSGQISSGGSLGIGITPAYPLNVAGSSVVGSIYDTATLAVGVGGELYLAAKNASAAQIAYATVKAHAQVGTAGAEYGSLLLRTMQNGAIVSGIKVYGANLGIASFASGVTPQANLHVGLTAGTARVYNSFTDASNGEWSYMGDWGKAANVATYGTDKNGSGVTRNWQILAGGTNVLDYGVTTALTLTTAASQFNAGRMQGTLTSSGTAINSVGGGLILQNTNGTTDNWQTIQLSDGTAAVVFIGARFHDRTNHYGDFQISIKAADGIINRLDWGISNAALWTFGAAYVPKSGTYANRPTGPAGTVYNVTDSNTATWGATIAGGGANNVMARYNGTNWTVVGA